MASRIIFRFKNEELGRITPAADTCDECSNLDRIYPSLRPGGLTCIFSVELDKGIRIVRVNEAMGSGIS